MTRRIPTISAEDISSGPRCLQRSRFIILGYNLLHCPVPIPNSRIPIKVCFNSIESDSISPQVRKHFPGKKISPVGHRDLCLTLYKGSELLVNCQFSTIAHAGDFRDFETSIPVSVPHAFFKGNLLGFFSLFDFTRASNVRLAVPE